VSGNRGIAVWDELPDIARERERETRG